MACPKRRDTENSTRVFTFLASMVAAAQFVVPVSPSTWKVGDNNGWDTQVDYSQWVTGKSFHLGDVLFFRYTKGKHRVLEVSEEDYGTCTTARPISSYSEGNTSITLNTTGSHYFICGIPGHCLDGMALVTTVTNGSSTLAPTPAPAPSGSPSQSPAPVSSPSVSSPLSSSSPTVTTPTSPAPQPAESSATLHWKPWWLQAGAVLVSTLLCSCLDAFFL